MQSLATLQEATEWAQAHWHENRVAPTHINQAHVTDGELGGLRFAKGFIRTLDAHPSDTTDAARMVECLHPMLRTADIRDCPECQGAKVKTVNVDRFRYPMWRALTQLQNALRPRRQPHPYSLILDLVEHGWDPRATARAKGVPWDMAEALYLRALRQLHGRYQQGPIGRRSWIDKSDSQRMAEAVA
jgi:hypothetical protein